MALSLKNEETEQLVRRLARITDESLTTAVTVAVQERIERLEKSDKRKGRLEWLSELTKQTSAMMDDGRTSKELMDELYDPETGLPA
jgi:antitoxin VapB